MPFQSPLQPGCPKEPRRVDTMPWALPSNRLSNAPSRPTSLALIRVESARAALARVPRWFAQDPDLQTAVRVQAHPKLAHSEAVGVSRSFAQDPDPLSWTVI